MFKKNSIFIKVLIPVIIVMLLQTLLISVVLFANGTIRSLDDNALESLRKNNENRTINLEKMMVFYWSNLDKLEMDVSGEIGKYLEEQNLSLTEALGSYQHQLAMLDNLSEDVIGALRLTSSTGVYVYFLDGLGYREMDFSLNGLYYRDLNPISTPADNSDLLYLRGYIDIARKDRISLDSLWNEAFRFSPEEEDTWQAFAAPQIAARQNPRISAQDLAYWSKPHLQNPSSTMDANPCITYTRPVFYQGQLVAMIGSEVQLSFLEKQYPAGDFGNSGKSGYMLICYNQQDRENTGRPVDCYVYSLTGSYVKRLIGSLPTVALNPAGHQGVYTLMAENIDSSEEKVQVVTHDMNLYNSYGPFTGEQWALAAISMDSEIFSSSRNISQDILLSSIISLLAGGLVLAVIIRLTTKPFITIAQQIETSDPLDPIVVNKSNTYEIALLCSTINAMRDRRSITEAQMREERERYLVALESADDTFMEYDIGANMLLLYYFDGIDGSRQLCWSVVENLTDTMHAGNFCHPDDIQTLLLFMAGKLNEPVEVRLLTALFPQISGVESDNGYYWFLSKASRLHNEEGALTKIIGTAREITQIKRDEFARIETQRRDPVTGLYNHEYGQKSIKLLLLDAVDLNLPYALCLLHVEDFDKFEAHYGRVFSSVIMRSISHELLELISAWDVAVRLGNDDMLVFFYNTTRQDAAAKIFDFYEKAAHVYVGENADLPLNISAGFALHTDSNNPRELLRCAYTAARHAMKSKGGRIAFFGELAPSVQKEDVNYREKPVNVFSDISRDTIAGFVFELFERTSDIHSAINILLPLLGELFQLRQIVVCTYDADFSSDQVSYQWHTAAAKPRQSNIEKVTRQDLGAYEALLDEIGGLVYTEKIARHYSEGVCRMLHVSPGGSPFNAYCCAMTENSVHVGRAIFVATAANRLWTENERYILYEITKIITAHLSIEKSHSASRAKSEFLSRISHEIRTPMNAIIGLTDIAQKSQEDSGRVQDCLAKISFSAQHLLSLINDVLEMSRIESGKLHIDMAPLSLWDFCAGVETLMRPPLENKKINFEINCNIRHEQVLGDEYRLRQVLVNLLGNANKFTDPGGRVTFCIDELPALLEADSAYASYRFSVRDTGIGISPEEQPLIFRAFEQATSSDSSYAKQGTGLGLAISVNIVSAMGGKIELLSQLGQGSEFFFILRMPLNQEALSGGGAEGQRQQKEDDFVNYFQGKTALLVEDNEINIEIAAYLLEEAGFSFDIARNGQEAVDMFFASQVNHYDVVLMDIQMPIMDGLDATRHIRKNTDRLDARTTPIIAMTANAFDEDMKKSIESGMNGHIAKPIDNKKLYGLLKQLCDNEEDIS